MADKISTAKTKSQESEQVLSEKGKYMAFDKMAVEEGGLNNILAVRRAASYCRSCLLEGSPFVIWNEMKESLVFLVFDKCHENIFRDKWALTQKEYSVQDMKKTDKKEIKMAAAETPEKMLQQVPAQQVQEGATEVQERAKAKALQKGGEETPLPTGEGSPFVLEGKGGAGGQASASGATPLTPGVATPGVLELAKLFKVAMQTSGR